MPIPRFAADAAPGKCQFSSSDDLKKCARQSRIWRCAPLSLSVIPARPKRSFQTLLDFIEELRFDRVGAFEFSFEPGTACEPLGDTVPAAVKKERFNRLMEKQQKISLEINKTFIGRKLDVLFEGYGQDLSVGPSNRDAPEIDGLVLVKGEIPPSQMLPVQITEAIPYDSGGIPIAKKQPAS